mgnify:CR=1 FL=1
MGWKFWEKEGTRESEIPAQRAVERSEENLKRAQARWDEVRSVSGPGRTRVTSYVTELEKLLRGT